MLQQKHTPMLRSPHSGISTPQYPSSIHPPSSDLVQQKQDLLQKIKIQRQRNKHLKQQIQRDYLEYNQKVKVAEEQVKVLRQKYEQYEKEIGEMAATVDKMGL